MTMHLDEDSKGKCKVIAVVAVLVAVTVLMAVADLVAVAVASEVF